MSIYLKDIIKHIEILKKEETGLNTDTINIISTSDRYEVLCAYLSPFGSMKHIKEEVFGIETILFAQEDEELSENLIIKKFIGFEKGYTANVSLVSYEFFPHLYYDLKTKKSFINYNNSPIVDDKAFEIDLQSATELLLSWAKLLEALDLLQP